jgi:chaperonin cofactor prefoldin
MQAMIDAYRSADGRVKDLIGKQQALDAQLTENGMVKTELDALKEGEPVYKLQGKILVLHDPSEAKATVSQRITMIEGEMWVAASARKFGRAPTGAKPSHPAPSPFLHSSRPRAPCAEKSLAK